MAASIDQIAARAGVSTSTVARVLRGEVKGAQKRSAKKSAEILRISEELGYQPNWRARALSRGKTHTIGLLYSDPHWIFDDPMNEIAVSFTEALQQQNYDLRLIPINENSSEWKELILGSAVDGLALQFHTPELAEDVIRKSGLPLITLGKRFDDAPCIMPGDVHGAYLATRHLLGLGHKRIVYYVADTIRPHISVEERREGYEKAMVEAGLEANIAAWHFDVGKAMDHLLGEDRPTAMIGYCQVEAMRITHAAWANGLAIPTDLSLITFNDMAMTQYMTPPLSVVRFDTAEIGRLGAEMLIQQIEASGTSCESVIIPERLVIRGTTARPSGR